jgi:hypothetical protein
MTFEILSEKDIRSYLIFTLGVFRAFEPIDRWSYAISTP